MTNDNKNEYISNNDDYINSLINGGEPPVTDDNEYYESNCYEELLPANEPANKPQSNENTSPKQKQEIAADAQENPSKISYNDKSADESIIEEIATPEDKTAALGNAIETVETANAKLVQENNYLLERDKIMQEELATLRIQLEKITLIMQQFQPEVQTMAKCAMAGEKYIDKINETVDTVKRYGHKANKLYDETSRHLHETHEKVRTAPQTLKTYLKQKAFNKVDNTLRSITKIFNDGIAMLDDKKEKYLGEPKKSKNTTILAAYAMENAEYHEHIANLAKEEKLPLDEVQKEYNLRFKNIIDLKPQKSSLVQYKFLAYMQEAINNNKSSYVQIAVERMLADKINKNLIQSCIRELAPETAADKVYKKLYKQDSKSNLIEKIISKAQENINKTKAAAR